MNNFRYLFLFFLIFFIALDLNALEFKKISIKGNERITNDTIIRIINFKKNTNYNLDQINLFQKKLIETNFFKNVKVGVDNAILNISVSENPLIDFFFIEGVINKKREEYLFENLNLGSNKIFSDYLLKKDISFIKKSYQDSGYFDANVNVKMSKLSNNTLNLVLEVSRGEKYNINQIFFIGNEKYSQSLLRDIIASAEYGWWKLFSTNSVLSQNRINYDASLLKNFYLNEGYYDVQITSTEIDLLSSNLANITFSINTGLKYNFSSFSIEDKQSVISKEAYAEINKILSKYIKGYFSTKKIQKTKDKIFNLINSKNLDSASYRLNLIKNSNKIEVMLEFYKMNEIFVNNINLSGNTITEEEVIRRNLSFSEGDTFTEYKLDKSIDTLKATRIFKNIETKKKLKSENLIDIDLKVEEQPTGTIMAGVGVGSSSSSISSGINEKNLFGKGINSNINASLGTEKISGLVSLDIPDFNNSGNTFGYDLYVKRTAFDNATYKSTVIGNDVNIGYEIYDDIGLNYGLGLDRDKISANSSTSSLYKSRSGNYITYKANYDVFSDKRNRVFSPSSGYKVGFGQILGLPGSDIPYIGNNIYGTYYYPYSNDVVFNVKGGFNSVNSLNNKDIKLSDRKYLSNKYLRGFESQGIGPKDGKDHVGGNYSAYSSISSTLPNFTPDKWDIDTILFIDAGNVWGVDYDSSKDNDKIRSSYGISLDWISPLGPISFTLSEIIEKADGDLEENFSFQLGSSF